MSTTDSTRPVAPDFDPRQVTRPDPLLMKYYVYSSFLAGPLFPIVLLPLYFKYHTLEYKFDDEGVSMRWGILFRREVFLTYRRIQDIHLTRNLFQRWLGLATVSVQTASGSAMPEMMIEGIPQAEELRDFFYAHMRGGHLSGGVHASGGVHSSGDVRAEAAASARAATALDSQIAAHGEGPETTADREEVSRLLRDIRDQLKRTADRLEKAS